MEIKKPMTENQKFYGNKLYKFLVNNNTVTKEEMLDHLGWEHTMTNDRKVRELLSLIGKKVPLVSVSSSKGYFIAKTEKDLIMVEHSLLEWQSRKDEADARMKPLLDFRDEKKFNIKK